jgi:protein-tyrosine phosphatase
VARLAPEALALTLIDLHCHILPDLDDGALDLADSVAMARQAAADGIAVVCATPHIRHDHDVRIEELPMRIEELQRELDRREVPVRIAQGGEVSQGAARDLGAAALRGLSLGGAGWVLVEPSPGPIAHELPTLARDLAARGARVVVAHPERHAGEGFAERLHELAATGCLIQWTAEFIARLEPRDPFLAGLAGEGLVHLLASDAHSSHGGRPVRISPGAERLAAVCSPEQVRWIVREAPAAVLRGEVVAWPW